MNFYVFPKLCPLDFIGKFTALSQISSCKLTGLSWQKFFGQIFPACLLMDVTFVLLISSSFLRSILRWMIFHNLKRISLLNLYMNIYIYIYKERQRDSTDKTNRKEVWFDFHMQNLKYSCWGSQFYFQWQGKTNKASSSIATPIKKLSSEFPSKNNIYRTANWLEFTEYLVHD